MAAQNRGVSRLGRDDDKTPYVQEEEDQSTIVARPDSNGESEAAIEQHRKEPKHSQSLDRTIYILGTGSIGKLVAHALRSLPNPPPVTLLLHRASLLRAWKARQRNVITLQSAEDGVETESDGFDAQLAIPPRRQHGVELRDGVPNLYDIASDQSGMKPHEAAHLFREEKKMYDRERSQRVEPLVPNDETNRTAEDIEGPGSTGSQYVNKDVMTEETIYNLIVSVKTPITLSAISSVRHRLTSESTICFLQNGMGIIDEINEKLFPDEMSRPSYIQGIVTHGANVPAATAARDPFYVVHAGQGTIALGLLPREKPVVSTPRDESSASEGSGDKWSRSARHLLRTLTRSPLLSAAGLTPNELLQQQLEKLAVNSVMNPLTALIDSRNGALLYNFPLTRTMRLMLAETSLIIRSLPELQGVVNVQQRFSPERLETLVVGVSNKTAQNVSSMLADIRAGRETEIDYINGYIVRRGEELGIKAVVNYGIMNAVIGKSLITQRETQEDVPMAEDPAFYQQ